MKLFTLVAVLLLAGAQTVPQQIAFVSDRDGNHEIYLMDADGGNLHNLTGNSAVDRSPAWSPDGAQIVFVSQRDQKVELYVMNPDGQKQIRDRGESPRC